MSTPLTVNGITFQYPTANDQSWGQQATLWATAITAAVIPKAGGTFALTGEVDFGTQYGLHVKSLRLNNADVVSWRNAANSADLSLTVNSSNVLTFNGGEVFNGPGYVYNLSHATVPTATSTQPGALTAAHSDGHLNLLTMSNPVNSYTLPALATAGQIKQMFTQQSSGNPQGNQWNVYYSFDSNPLFYGTGSIHLPNGTTTQRQTATQAHPTNAADPASGTAVTDTGSFRYNTDYKTTEYYDGKRWVPNAYGDQLRVAPQMFDDFLNDSSAPIRGWKLNGDATATLQEGTYNNVFGTVLLNVPTTSTSVSTQMYKEVDCNPTVIDYVEWRILCTKGAAVSCGAGSTRGFGFTASFTGGSSSAHGTGTWHAYAIDDNQSIDIDTGVSVSFTPTFQTLRAERTDSKTVKFYIDGTLVATATFTANITRATGVSEPFCTIQGQNVSGSYYGQVLVDYALVKMVNVRN